MNPKPPTPTKIISTINGTAAILHLTFWLYALLKLPNLATTTTLETKTNLATVYGFGLADLLFSVPLLAIGAISLWKMKFHGWVAAQMANLLYWYSFTIILSRDLAAGALAPGTMLFLPFAIFSIWAAIYLWRVRERYLPPQQLGK